MRKNILTAILMSSLAALPLSCEARTLPSGTSGVINAPSAYVRSMGHAAVTYQYTEDYKVIGGNVAVLPGLEVAYSRWSEDAGDDFNMYSAKYMIIQETVASPAFAVGVEDITDEKDRSGYAVISKAGPWGLKLHAGAGTGRFRDGFVGFEKQFKVNSNTLNLGLAAEYDGDNFNYGMFVPVGKLMQAEVGMRDEKFYAGVHGIF
ncbi:MAG: YjbH domain-containing protein [Acidaminococcaceae bacterium]